MGVPSSSAVTNSSSSSPSPSSATRTLSRTAPPSTSLPPPAPSSLPTSPCARLRLPVSVWYLCFLLWFRPHLLQADPLHHVQVRRLREGRRIRLRQLLRQGEDLWRHEHCHQPWLRSDRRFRRCARLPAR